MHYDLADFDLYPEDVRRATQPYLTRFGISQEWPAVPVARHEPTGAP